MGTTSLAGGVKLPGELAGDPVEAAWSTAKKGFNSGRIIVPGLLSLSNKVASSASASSALFVIGTANVMLLYVNIWMALGGAYARNQGRRPRVRGTLLGFATGFGFQPVRRIRLQRAGLALSITPRRTNLRERSTSSTRDPSTRG